MRILLLLPFIFTHIINLVVLYEKTGLKEVKDMYHYVIERLLDKFNEHLQRRGIRIGLLDVLAYDDYLGKPEYEKISVMGGEESLDARAEALQEIPANVILVASASPEEEQERFIPNSPCMSRFISNMVSNSIVDDELLTKIIYAVLDWMGNLFKADVPSPIKEKSPEVFDKFAKDASTPEFIESLKQCTRETKGRFEKFVKMLNWDEEKMLGMRSVGEKPDLEEQGDRVEISSPLKWVLPRSEAKRADSGPLQPPLEERPKKRHTSPSDDENSSESEEGSPRKILRGESSSNRKKTPSGKAEEGESCESEEKEADMPHDQRRTRDFARYFDRSSGSHGAPGLGKENEALMEEKIREQLQKIISYESHGLRRRPEDLPIPARMSYEDERGVGSTPSKILFSSKSIPAKSMPKMAKSLSYGRIPYRGG